MNAKRISDILAVVCLVAIFAGCVEGLDGGPTLWTVFCLAVAGASGWAAKKLESKHISK